MPHQLCSFKCKENGNVMACTFWHLPAGKDRHPTPPLTPQLDILDSDLRPGETGPEPGECPWTPGSPLWDNVQTPFKTL